MVAVVVRLTGHADHNIVRDHAARLAPLALLLLRVVVAAPVRPPARLDAVQIVNKATDRHARRGPRRRHINHFLILHGGRPRSGGGCLANTSSTSRR